MSLLSILETLLIGPLKLAFELIFEYADRFTGHPGLSIVCLSLVMNVLVLPLYRRADAMQEQARDTEAKLRDGVAHIKKTFSGDERMMMLQTYYRQNHYKPTDALNGSVSLLLEIPFFIAAYQFLSHLGLLEGVELGPIRDLSQPDALLTLGGLSVNVLPLLMTGINLLSGAIYLKGFPAKAKAQLYTMAGLFLVLLYRSPSGLVFYWTLNNLFSLAKNIFYKMRDPRRVLRWLCAGAGAALAVFGLFFYETEAEKRKIILAVVGLALCLPLMLRAIPRKVRPRTEGPRLPDESGSRLFLAAGIFLTVLVGLLIPSEYIAASPQEYVDMVYYQNPLWYTVSSLCMAAGTFLIWLRVFYWLASPVGKDRLTKALWVICALTLIDYMFFGTDLGVISASLQYKEDMSFTRREILINLLVLAAAAGGMLLWMKRGRRSTAAALAVAALAMGGMSVKNLAVIKKAVDRVSMQAMTEAATPSFRLSKTGKNVVFIMLDRSIGGYIPYVFNEKPELKEKFSGFTYYGNTISFGGYTNFGASALFGGYEYTPVEMNRRDTELLVEKHNEALRVLPVLFLENGYEVTMCDTPYANYQYVADMSIFDGYPEIKTYNTMGWFGDEEETKVNIKNTHRNFFCFSLMKTLPLAVQPTFYDHGAYHQPDPFYTGGGMYITQIRDGLSVSTGVSYEFMDPYRVLENMNGMTEITSEKVNTFLSLANDTTHEPQMLQEPDYLPAQHVDNTAYDASHADRFILDGRELKITNDLQMIHYQADMAAMLRLGDWFDYLRLNGVYDNTRIILAADHGWPLAQFDELILDDGSDETKNVEFCYPLLMVKDFDSEGFSMSEEFMTNADVPSLLTERLISEPVNPFTGKRISSEEKTAHEQFVIRSHEWNVAINSGNTYLPAPWASVKENIWDPSNWTFYDEETVLTEHRAPQ